MAMLESPLESVFLAAAIIVLLSVAVLTLTVAVVLALVNHKDKIQEPKWNSTRYPWNSPDFIESRDWANITMNGNPREVTAAEPVKELPEMRKYSIWDRKKK